MKNNYLIHEDMYVEARKAGWDGWGGNKRLQGAELVSRFFEVEDNLPRTGNLLELGCGEGHHCRAFAELGYEVTGVDISPTAIEWAQEKADFTGIKGNFIAADLTDSEFELEGEKQQGFHIVIDGNCLHCILGEDRKVFLKRVHDLLLKGGVFFVSSLCLKDEALHTDSQLGDPISNDNSSGDFQVLEKQGKPYRHVSRVERLLSELEQAGFSILASKVYEREHFNHITVHALKKATT